MNRFGRRLLTAALCTTLLTGSTLTAAAADATVAGQETTIDGANTVEDPIYSVTIPATLEFAVDAFEQKGEGQIVSTDISCTNNSNVAVKMNVALTVADGITADTVTFATSADDVSTEEDVKSVFMQAQVAETVTETKNAAAAYTTAVVKDGAGTYYTTDDVAKAVTGNDGVVTSAATEMESVKSVTGTAADTPVAYTLGTEATELDFALAASDYIKYYTSASATAQQFKTTAADNKSSACYTFTGKVNPNAVWAANDFKATAVYTFKGMTTTDYEAAEFETGAHALLKKPVAPVAPTFASTTKGVITWSGDAGTGAVSEITKIEVKIGNTTYNLLAEQSGLWEAATVDLVNKKITLDSGVADNLGSDLTATITYEDSSSTPVTKTAENVTVKLTN